MIKICEICKVEFEAIKNKKYCDNIECLKAKYKYKSKYNGRDLTTEECKMCGDIFTGYRYNHFCKKCIKIRILNRTFSTILTKKCRCGKEFQTTNARKINCSKECSKYFNCKLNTLNNKINHEFIVKNRYKLCKEFYDKMIKQGYSQDCENNHATMEDIRELMNICDKLNIQTGSLLKMWRQVEKIATG